MLLAFFPQAYEWANTMGVAAHIVVLLGLLLLLWRRHAKAGTATAWLPTWQAWRYFGKAERRRFNPATFVLCYAAAFVALAFSLEWVDYVFNRVEIRGVVHHFPGSVSFAGGVLVFMAVLLIFAAFFPGNGKPLQQLQLAMPGLALQHAFNRFACLLGGCCHGVPHRFGMAFPDVSLPSFRYGAGTEVFPSQLVEIGVMLLLFGVLLWLQLRGKRHYPLFPLVFGLTGFLLGFVRSPMNEPLPPMFGWLYPTPLAHAMVFGVGVVFAIWWLCTRKKNASASRQ